MTIKFDNVYINETGTITGPYEKNGPLQSFFDKSYNDFYFGLKTWEQIPKLLPQGVVEAEREISELPQISEFAMGVISDWKKEAS